MQEIGVTLGQAEDRLDHVLHGVTWEEVDLLQGEIPVQV